MGLLRAAGRHGAGPPPARGPHPPAGPLERRRDRGSLGFIAGGGRLAIVEGGAERVRWSDRETRAADFDARRIRLLVSTEAGGEGIGLRRRYAHLVHVAPPWNPMRLHQRVGRPPR